MGRGRAKAKQVKVARQLKYSGGGTDLDRLRAELGVGTDEQVPDGQDAYADLSDRYSVADDEDDDDEDEDLDDFDEGFGAGPATGHVNGNGSASGNGSAGGASENGGASGNRSAAAARMTGAAGG